MKCSQNCQNEFRAFKCPMLLLSFGFGPRWHHPMQSFGLNSRYPFGSLVPNSKPSVIDELSPGFMIQNSIHFPRETIFSQREAMTCLTIGWDIWDQAQYGTPEYILVFLSFHYSYLSHWCLSHLAFPWTLIRQSLLLAGYLAIDSMPCAGNTRRKTPFLSSACSHSSLKGCHVK